MEVGQREYRQQSLLSLDAPHTLLPWRIVLYTRVADTTKKIA